MKSQLIVEGQKIGLEQINGADFISLTDIAKKFKDTSEPYNLIANWLKSKSTLSFLEAWEGLFNPDFKPLQMQGVKADSIGNRFTISPQAFIDRTGAISLAQKTGRGGGTWAHKDVALEFLTWIDPFFKVYFIREFDRLKNEEAKTKNLEWHVERITDLVEETRNWLDTIPGQKSGRNRLDGPKTDDL